MQALLITELTIVLNSHEWDEKTKKILEDLIFELEPVGFSVQKVMYTKNDAVFEIIDALSKKHGEDSVLFSSLDKIKDLIKDNKQRFEKLMGNFTFFYRDVNGNKKVGFFSTYGPNKFETYEFYLYQGDGSVTHHYFKAVLPTN